MKKRTIYTVVAIGFASVAFCGYALSQLRGTETEPRVQLILSALESQEGLAGGRLELEVVVRTPEDGDTPQTSYHYIRTPQMLWMETFYDKSTMQEAYDRVTYETRSRTRMKDTGRESCIVSYSESYPSLDGQKVLDVARTMRPKIAKGMVAEQMETIDGHSCWRIDLPPYEEGLASYSVWVDPMIGFCPRRREIRQTDQSFTITQYRDYREVSENVWIPMSAQIEAEYHTVPPGYPKPVLRVVQRVTVRQVRVGDAVPSPPAVEVPSGAHQSVGPRGETLYTTPEPTPPDMPSAQDKQETEAEEGQH